MYSNMLITRVICPPFAHGQTAIGSPTDCAMSPLGKGVRQVFAQGDLAVIRDMIGNVLHAHPT